MNERLSDRINVLRDEVLETAEQGDRDPPGAEVFEAVLRLLDRRAETSPGLDMIMREAISRRIAWGDEPSAILADADGVCKRLLDAAERSLREPAEEIAVARVVAEIGCIVARFVCLEELARTARARSSLLRDELAQSRLRQALARQKEEIERMSKALELKF